MMTGKGQRRGVLDKKRGAPMRTGASVTSWSNALPLGPGGWSLPSCISKLIGSASQPLKIWKSFLRLQKFFSLHAGRSASSQNVSRRGTGGRGERSKSTAFCFSHPDAALVGAERRRRAKKNKPGPAPPFLFVRVGPALVSPGITCARRAKVKGLALSYSPGESPPERPQAKCLPPRERRGRKKVWRGARGALNFLTWADG